ncbi:hypothetical protein [Jeotgalibacillus terrae]|uniref:Immunity protein 63 domain-containing protein n=1 Tax=Jeotgalibacillus terrae TaxID=587735 RepID=A0ABW5ZGV4_9BACL|nr:hypothetical protein [Jeotgalibacillus terrae]MBM7581138.1 hypothetical protein [Jeotgalibacillus terrae]
MKTLFLEQVQQLLSDKDYSDLIRNYSHFINTTDQETASLFYYDSDTNEVLVIFTEGGIYLDHCKESHRYPSEFSFEKTYDLVYPNKIGRPSLGVTKKVSLTLSEEIWSFVDRNVKEQSGSRSKYLRGLIERDYIQSQKEVLNE